LFDAHSYKEAQALKNDACINPAVECRFVAKDQVPAVSRAGRRVLWQRDLRETWSPDMFFEGAAGSGDNEFVDMIILKR
jgi:hypothetical protein